METLTLLDLTGTLFGLLYLYLEYRASIHLWVVSMVMPAIDLFVYYQAGLYADFGMATDGLFGLARNLLKVSMKREEIVQSLLLRTRRSA